MIPLSVGEIAVAVGGVVHGDADVLVTGAATIDSRTATDGSLFVAIAGESVDGHDYVASAMDQGAAAVLATRPVQAPCIVVPDATQALGRLARHVLDRVEPTVIAITGSQGKTSVKDLVAYLLAYDVVATQGNYNNELGVPLTVLRIEESTRHLVVEMGARGIGHVAALCRIAPPDVAVVLNVGSAHVGEFGSVDNIAVAKGELVEALRPDGVAVLNGDDPRVVAMAERVPRAAQARFFGRGLETTREMFVRLVDVVLDGQGEPDVTLASAGEVWTDHVPLVGAHHAMNLAAAVAAILADSHHDGVMHGSEPPLSQFRPPSPMRMERRRRTDGVVVVDDSYNANPESMEAALRAVRDMGADRRVAVLGEMLELGPDGAEQHARIGRLAAELGYDRVVAVGPGAHGIAEGSGPIGTVVDDVEAAVDTLRTWLVPLDVVLVKASRGARLERVTHGLLAD